MIPDLRPPFVQQFRRGRRGQGTARGRQLDPDRVFLRDHLRYDLLATDALAVDIAGRNVEIVSKQRLIAMKRQVHPPRPKDLWDIDYRAAFGPKKTMKMRVLGVFASSFSVNCSSIWSVMRGPPETVDHV